MSEVTTNQRRLGASSPAQYLVLLREVAGDEWPAVLEEGKKLQAARLAKKNAHDEEVATAVLEARRKVATYRAQSDATGEPDRNLAAAERELARLEKKLVKGEKVKRRDREAASAPTKLTKEAVAAAYLDARRGELRLVDGLWLRWDGVRWASSAAFPRNDLRVYLDELHARALADENKTATSFYEKCLSDANGLKGIVTDQAADAFGEDAVAWDLWKDTINTPSGELHLPTGELFPHDPEHYHTKTTKVPYSPAARCPTWLSHIDTMTNGDVELARAYQIALGAALSEKNIEHAFITCVGHGGDGKSTVLGALRAVFGEYAAVGPDGHLWGRNTPHPEALLGMKGARFITIDEIDDKHPVDSTLLKKITGGEPIRARAMYGKGQEVTVQGRMVLTGNTPLLYSTTDGGMGRRHLYLPVVGRPTADDKSWKERVIAEAEGILVWLLEGYQLWRAAGFETPQVHANVVDVRREEASDRDDAAKLIEDYIDVDVNNPEYRISGEELATIASTVSRMYGVGNRALQRSVLSQLRALGVEKREYRSVSGPRKAYFGARRRPKDAFGA